MILNKYNKINNSKAHGDDVLVNNDESEFIQFGKLDKCHTIKWNSLKMVDRDLKQCFYPRAS